MDIMKALQEAGLDASHGAGQIALMLATRKTSHARLRSVVILLRKSADQVEKLVAPTDQGC